MSKKVVFWLVVAIVVVALIYHNATKHTQETSPSSVKIAVSKTPLSAPFYIAEQQSLFPQHCSKVEFIDVSGGHNSFKAVMSEQADFGTSSDSVIAYQNFERQDYVSYGAFVQSDNDIKLIVNSQIYLQNLSEKQPIKLGVAVGSASEYFLDLFIAFNSINRAAVKIVNIPPDAMETALADGIVDGVSIWEPYAFEIVQNLKQDVAVAQSKSLYSLSFNLIARADSDDHSKQIASCILAGLHAANQFIALNQASAQDIVKKRLQLNQSFIQWIWDDYLFKLSLGESILLNFQSLTQWKKEKSHPNRPQRRVEQIVDASAMQRVAPSMVSISLKSMTTKPVRNED